MWAATCRAILRGGDGGLGDALRMATLQSAVTAPIQWMQHGGTFTAGQAQYADINGNGKFDLLVQGNDNSEYLSVSSGPGFGAPTLVADFGAFEPGILHV